MRIAVLVPLVMLAACSATPDTSNASAAKTEPPGLRADAPAAPGMRGPEPATSPGAIAAKKLVEQYYALIAQKKFAEARLMWGNKGADVGGDVAAFAKTITPYSVYQPKVGEPTHIKVDGGMQYVNVGATLHVQRADDKLEADRNGVVMLYRSADPNDKDVDKRDWKIRGIDIRVRD